MKQAPCTSELMATVKTVLLIRQWYRNRSVNRLCKRQAVAVRNRRKAIDNAHMMSLMDEAPSKYWLGYFCDKTQSGQIRVAVKQNGDLPEVVQNDCETTIYLSVRVSSQTKNICLVHQGKQQQPTPVVFDEVVTDSTTNQLNIFFEVYFVTGRVIKKKHPITAWTETEDCRTLMKERLCSWKLITKLSTQPRSTSA